VHADAASNEGTDAYLTGHGDLGAKHAAAAALGFTADAQATCMAAFGVMQRFIVGARQVRERRLTLY
jgi:hypothetical protein